MVGSQRLQIDEIRCEPPFFERIATAGAQKLQNIERVKPAHQLQNASAPDAKPQTPSTRSSSSSTHLQVHGPHPIAIPGESVHAPERRRLEGPPVRVLDRRRVATMEGVRFFIILFF